LISRRYIEIAGSKPVVRSASVFARARSSYRAPSRNIASGVAFGSGVGTAVALHESLEPQNRLLAGVVEAMLFFGDLAIPDPLARAGDAARSGGGDHREVAAKVFGAALVALGFLLQDAERLELRLGWRAAAGRLCETSSRPSSRHPTQSRPTTTAPTHGAAVAVTVAPEATGAAPSRRNLWRGGTRFG